MYAKELVSSEDSYNKQSGYYVILSPELRSMSDSKTIEQYVNDYGSSLENLLNSNSNQLALIQQASYNYNKHIENNERLERRNHRLKIMIAALVATLLLICVAYLYKQNRYKTRIIELQNAVRNIDLVREDLISKAKGTADSNMDAEKMAESIPNEDDLIEDLKAKLRDIANNPEIDRKTPQEIILSDTYKKIQEHINNNRQIGESDCLWDEIEDLVLKSSPKFKLHLIRLFGDKLNSKDVHTMLLVKCGITPTQQAVLLGRSKNAISSRRASIGLKILNGKFETKDIDRVIRAL